MKTKARLSYLSLVGVLLLLPGLLSAAKVKFNWDDSVTGASFTSDTTVAADIDEKLETAKRKAGDFADLLELPGSVDFLNDLGDSHIHTIGSMFAMPGKKPKYFVVGAASAFTYVDTGALFGETYSNISFLLGLNPEPLGMPEIGFIDPKHLLLMGGFYTHDFDNGNFSGELLHASILARYQVIPDRDPGFWADWHGINLTTGLVYSTARFIHDPELNGVKRTEPEYVLTYRGPSQIGVESNTFTLPVELETDITLLSFLNLFAGAGLDFNVSDSKNISTIGGNVRFEYRNTSQTKTIGTAKLRQVRDTSPTLVVPRYHLGAMVDIGAVARIYFRLGMTGGRNLAGSLGLRVLW